MTSQIKNVPKHVMPREKMMEKGVANLRDAELLAILLRTGMVGKNVLEVARSILRRYPMRKLLSLTYQDLSEIKGIGPAKACLLLAAFELTKRGLLIADDTLPVIADVMRAVEQLQELRTAKKEHLIALYLNARNQLIHKEIVSIGTLNASLIHPREVFKPAIDCLAASVIIAHNHPSGDTEPSHDDCVVTKRLQDAGVLLGIDLVDHIIMTNSGFYSFQESGRL